MIEEILNRSWLVGLDVPVWTGTAKVDLNDLRLADGTQLPKSVYKAGSMYVVNKDVLNPFTSLKREAERAVGAVGIRSNLFRGFLVPRNKWDDLENTLLQVKQKHADLKDDFMKALPGNIEAWALDHTALPGVSDAIRQAAPSMDYVRSVLHFRFGRLRATLEGVDLSDAEDTKAEILGLHDNLLDQIAREATEMVKAITAAPDTFDRRRHSTFQRWCTRLNDLAFLDPALQPAADALQDLLNSFPTKGSMRKEDYYRALSTAMILADPQSVKEMAKGLLTVEQVMSHDTDYEQVRDHDLLSVADSAPAEPAKGKVPAKAKAKPQTKKAAAQKPKDAAPNIVPPRVPDGGKYNAWF